MQWFIAHLSLADIFVAIFNILPQLIMDITNQFHGGDFLCKFIKYVSVPQIITIVCYNFIVCLSVCLTIIFQHSAAVHQCHLKMECNVLFKNKFL